MKGAGIEPWATLDGEGLQQALFQVKETMVGDSVLFLCIGTDRSTGDALGPLVGTGLKKAGFRRVFGTLDCPCDANTLPSFVSELVSGAREGETVIAVDAALGKSESIGKYQVTAGPLLPGASIGRSLPPVGDYGIAGIVNESGIRKYAILQNTSLYRVMGMAETIVAAAAKAFRA